MKLATLLARCPSALAQHLLLHRAYQRTFGGGDGPLVVQDLIRQFGGNGRSTLVFGMPDQSAYNEGARAVVLYIQKRMRLSEPERAALEHEGELPERFRDVLAMGDE